MGCDPPCAISTPSRRRRRGRRRLRLHAQGPAAVARRHAVSRGRAARPDGRARRAASSATPTSTPAASTAATSCASPAASSASATSSRSTCARSPRAAAGEADPAAFLPVAYRDLDELDGFLEHLAGEVRDRGFRALLDGVLGDDELRAALRRSPCTRGGHHAYLGGLLEHTVAVGDARVETCALHPRLDQDLLLTAAIVHDLGRTREFTLGAEIGLSDEGRLLGHVELGLRMLDERAARPGLDDARRLALAHCVLTHHGADAAPQRRFGSPEALALYRLNALDAGVKGAIEHGLASGGGVVGARSPPPCGL